MSDDSAQKVVANANQYRDKWAGKPDCYWFQRLSQEIGELGGVLAGDHDDTLEHELTQIASISINWLRRLQLDAAIRELK